MFWDRVAFVYDIFTDVINAKAHRSLCEVVADEIEDDDGVLECACGTCMVKPMEADTWEICKLGSNKNANHKGCGSAVFEAAMKWAEDHGAKRLCIISNSKLKAALHIYHKYGFQEIKLGDYEYVRGDIAFEKIL